MIARSDLTAQEQAHVRAALRFLRVRCGSLVNLAKVLGLKDTSLGNIVGGHRQVSASVAFRVARLAKVGVDDVLGGTYPPPGTCPHCGHQKEAAEAAE